MSPAYNMDKYSFVELWIQSSEYVCIAIYVYIYKRVLMNICRNICLYARMYVCI